MMDLRKIIQAEARLQALSGRALAKLAGISERGVQMYLRGDRDMTGAYLARLMVALGLEVRRKQ